MDIEDIELYCNLDFETEIKNKYRNIIVDLFNNNCPDYYINNEDLDIQILVGLYYFSKKDYDKVRTRYGYGDVIINNDPYL